MEQQQQPRVAGGKGGKSAAAAAGGEEAGDGGALFRMSDNSLNLHLLGASVGGMALGWYIRGRGVSTRLLHFPAELYVRMLESLVIPVVSSSIIAALGSIDIVLAGHIGLIAMLYFVLATGTASAIGIGVALILGPRITPCWRRTRVAGIDGFLDFLRNLVPDNYVEAFFYTTTTVGKNVTDTDRFETVREPRANILGVLSMSVVLGCILSVTVSESDVLLNLFVGLSNATVTVAHLTALYSPVGVFFLVATHVTQASQLDKTLTVFRTYLLLTLAGLAAYGLVLLPGLYALVTGQDPRRFLRVTLAPAVKAFRSASRAVSVPDTIEALEEAADLEPRIVRFVIPVGANVSMSGTALVVSAAAVTLATLDGLELGPEEMLIISVTVVLASLGAASIPNSGVLTVLMILMALEVSSRDISLVLVLDWLVDRLRMTVNIYSDSVGSAIVQQFSRLKPIEDSLDESLVPEQRPLVARLGKRASQFLPGSAVEGALHGADREEQLSSILRPLARRRGTLAYVPQPAPTPGGWRSPLKRASLRPSSSPRPAPSPSSTSSNATRDEKEKQVPVFTTGASSDFFDVISHANGQTPVRCQVVVDGTSPARSGIIKSSGQCLLDVRSPENRPSGQEEAVVPSEGAPSTSENLVHAAAGSKTGSRTRRRHRRLRGATGSSSKASKNTDQKLEVQVPEDPPRGLRQEAVAPSEGAPSTIENLAAAPADSKTGSRTRRRHRRRRGATGSSSKVSKNTDQKLEVQAPEDPPSSLRQEAVAPSEGAPNTIENFAPAVENGKTHSRTRRHHRRRGEMSPKSDDRHTSKGSGSKSQRHSKSRQRRPRHKHAQTATPWTISPNAHPTQLFDSTSPMDVLPG